MKFAESAGSEEVRAIRMDHVNEVVMLESVLKLAKDTGKVQPEIRDLLRKLAGVDDLQRKGGKKTLQKGIINDDIAPD